MGIALIDIGFLELRFLDIIDIIIVAWLMYLIYKLLRGTIAFNIFVGVVLLYLVWWVVGVLEMQLLSLLLGRFVAFGVIILIIIFQPEVRRFLVFLGNSTLKGRGWGIFERFFNQTDKPDSAQELKINEIKKAILRFSRNKTGALIVMMNGRDPELFSNNGTLLNGDISDALLESIFNKYSPLHDGAVIIAKDKIYSAGTVLPISANPDIPKSLGLRHRSAIGLTESSNVAVFVVSEENGQISYAYQGKIDRNIKEQKLLNKLIKHYTR